jgi:hypothetical protein
MASQIFGVPIDLNQFELQNAVCQNLAADPHSGSEVEAEFYYNTGVKRIKYWDGTAWQTIAVGPGVTDGDKGDITISGTGTVYTVDNDVVTYAKMQNASAGNVILGRVAGTSGDYSELAIGASELAGRGASGNLAAITVGTGLTMTGTTLSSTITQYTDEMAQDAIGATLTDTSTIDFTYNDGANTISAIVIDDSITYAKMQNIATSSVIGRMTAGTGDPETITVVTDIAASGSSTNLATSQAIINYVASLVTGLLDFKGNLDASTNPNYPAASKGDTYYISVAGKVGGASGEQVNIGDMLVASADNAGGTEASVGTSWFVVESNRDLATTASPGVVELATDAEAQAQSSSSVVITPSNLAAVTATETRQGLAEIATQAEVTTGTDDARIVTPLKLVTYVTGTASKFSQTIGDGVSTSFNIDHNFGTKDVFVQVYKISDGKEWSVDVTRSTTNRVVIAFGTAPASSAFRVIVRL